MTASWDEIFASGYNWQDEIDTVYNGKAVAATYNYQPGPPQYARIRFDDGSVLYLGWATPELDQKQFHNEIDHARAASALESSEVFSSIINPLYDAAVRKRLDVDFGHRIWQRGESGEWTRALP